MWDGIGAGGSWYWGMRHCPLSPVPLYDTEDLVPYGGLGGSLQRVQGAVVGGVVGCLLLLWCVSEFFFGLCIATTCFFLLVFWVPSPLSGPPPAAIERMRSAGGHGKLDPTLLEYESHNVMQQATSMGKQGGT